MSEKSRDPVEAADLLEEDDEFEEFEQQEWNAAVEDAHDADMWQDGWEDDEDSAELVEQLRAELKATEGTAPPAGVNPVTAAMSTAMQQ